MPRNMHRSRRLTLAIIALVALLAFGVIGGSAFANDRRKAPKAAGQSQYGSMGQYQYGKRVVICHKGRTIVVSGSAVRSHLSRKSSLGPCAVRVHKVKAKHKAKAKHRGQSERRGKGAKGVKSFKGGKIGVVKRSDGSGLAAVTITKPVSNGNDDDDDRDEDDDHDHDRKGKGRDRR